MKPWELQRFARFFEAVAPEPGEIEAAWQRFQDANGSHGVLRLAFSISHVLETAAREPGQEHRGL
jgi:hypothetical protein